MKMSLVPLIDVQSVNSFVYSTQTEFTEGNSVDIYFQIVDLEQKASSSYNAHGLRYIPADGATMQITLKSVDSARRVSRYATQPFPQDLSIWKFSVLSGDPVAGTVNISATLTEGTKITTATIQAFLLCQGTI